MRSCHTPATERLRARANGHDERRPRTFRPSIFGKIATATYIMTGVMTLYFNYLGYRSPLVTVFVYAALVITFISAGHYLAQVVKLTNPGNR